MGNNYRMYYRVFQNQVIRFCQVIDPQNIMLVSCINYIPKMLIFQDIVIVLRLSFYK